MLLYLTELTTGGRLIKPSEKDFLPDFTLPNIALKILDIIISPSSDKIV